MRKGAHSIQWVACSCLCSRPECRPITLSGTDGTNIMRYICVLFSDEVPELLSFLFLQRVYLPSSPSSTSHSGGSVQCKDLGPHDPDKALIDLITQPQTLQGRAEYSTVSAPHLALTNFIPPKPPCDIQ